MICDWLEAFAGSFVLDQCVYRFDFGYQTESYDDGGAC